MQLCAFEHEDCSSVNKTEWGVASETWADFVPVLLVGDSLQPFHDQPSCQYWVLDQNSVRQAERQDDEPDLKPRYESVQRAQQSGPEQKDREVEQTRYFFYLDQVFCEIYTLTNWAIVNKYALVKFKENFWPSIQL